MWDWMSCPACGSGDAGGLVRENGWMLYQCGDCLHEWEAPA